MRVFGDVLVVVWQYSLHELIFFRRLCLNHIATVMRVEEKLTRFGVRQELDEIVIAYNAKDT
jgi:hypothetical protein